MEEFKFKLLDTMGYLEDVIISKHSTSCSSLHCRKRCHHLLWIIHNVFSIDRNDPVMYKQKFSISEWSKLVASFPNSVPLAHIPTVNNQKYIVNVRSSSKSAKCAVCKNELVNGAVQVVTEGPYRTIHCQWVTHTFFFCAAKKCITKIPRNSYIRPYCPSTMPLHYDTGLTLEQRNLIAIS
ncbi:Hypothetical predicted protein [Paramuricea clavata]|uniref:Uncharacterized protein n=1 Tax=Paramuricea clavata TaxID=317549 RepID=A0A6S7IC54_PARCT|nr:Hypothetical predicted protein [Paramuricea clavata]